MKDQEKREWIRATGWKCYKALLAIEAAKKQSSSAYDRRIRMLEALQKELYVKDSDDGQLSLFLVDQALSDELVGLLDDPLGGL